jgi:hypothetical protein
MHTLAKTPLRGTDPGYSGMPCDICATKLPNGPTYLQKTDIYTLGFAPAPSNWVRRRRNASSTHILALQGQRYDTIRYNRHSNKQACASAFRKALNRACSRQIRHAQSCKVFNTRHKYADMAHIHAIYIAHIAPYPPYQPPKPTQTITGPGR